MGNGASRGIFRALGAVTSGLVFVGLGVSLSGCPVAAELENPRRFDIFNEPTVCDQQLPDGPNEPTIACDYKIPLNTHCARSACHNSAAAAKLNLTPDPLLIARILEVPAKHEITCSPMVFCDLTNPQCDECRMCSQGDFLLTKSNVLDSWILRKMNEFNVDMPSTSPKIGCGTAMPIAPGNTGFDAADRTCLTNFFTWIANNGKKCKIAAAGSGGGGAGGVSGGGAGSGGT